MDGTFGGGDLISASLAIMLGGNGDAELHDKEVSLTTSDVTGSQTAIFEYDPENEPTTGTPAGPWDGYSLFTIDLSGVKDDLEDLQQKIADAETCRQQVISVLQQYDPDYDPAEGECPASEVEDLVEAWEDDEDTIEELQDEIEACHDCKDAVVAAMQAIDPDYVLPASGCPDDIPQKAYEQGEEAAPEKYTFPKDPNGDSPYPDLCSIVGNDPVTDVDLDATIVYHDVPDATGTQHEMYFSVEFGDGTSIKLMGVDRSGSVGSDMLTNFKVTDPTTGAYTYYWTGASSWMGPYTQQYLIGYGDPSHTYKVTKG